MFKSLGSLISIKEEKFSLARWYTPSKEEDDTGGLLEARTWKEAFLDTHHHFISKEKGRQISRNKLVYSTAETENTTH